MKFQRYLHHILLIQTLPGAMKFLASLTHLAARHRLSERG